jgi:hypothetical protein
MLSFPRGVVMSILCGCASKPPGYESYSNHADGSPVTAEEHTDMNRRKEEECQRLYQFLGDRTLTPQQVEAIRVSMNAHFCARLVP